MCSARSLCLFLASAFTIFLGPSIGNAQNSKSNYETSLSHSDILLRRVVVKHPGCMTCNDTILNAEEEYVRKRASGGPDVVFSLEHHYEQKKVSNVKEALEDFWKERGIAVEVSTNLTRVTNASRDAVLEFDVCGKY
jgi:MoaA/NifB/PqqE/SkfB family radical SAM enzyme